MAKEKMKKTDIKQNEIDFEVKNQKMVINIIVIQ